MNTTTSEVAMFISRCGAPALRADDLLDLAELALSLAGELLDDALGLELRVVGDLPLREGYEPQWVMQGTLGLANGLPMVISAR